MKTICINLTDFDGDHIALPKGTITEEDVHDWIEAAVVLDGRPAGDTSVGGRWYLALGGAWPGRVFLVDLAAVAHRGHYYGGLDLDFEEEGSARDALLAYRGAA